MSILPRFLRPRGASAMTAIKVSPLLAETAYLMAPAALEKLQSSTAGLTQEQVQQRLEQHGHNVVAQEKRHTWVGLLGRAVVNPLVILLTVLAIVTFATAQEPSDMIGGWVMVAMVVLGVSLRFIQETKADAAAAKLKAMISVTATVVRDGKAGEVPLAELVPGDVVKLSAGDMETTVRRWN